MRATAHDARCAVYAAMPQARTAKMKSMSCEREALISLGLPWIST
jgi:hypothetical protein